MKLQINKETKIKDIQKKFSDAYPFLKIEFYKKPHGENELSSMKDKISPDELISENKNFIKAASLDINKHSTVAELEKEFYERFGIAMQVSRRAGNIWIETSLTDSRTLGVQNKQGKSASTVNANVSIDEDYER
ncbi:MAG TPA: hypothetical protein VMU83_16650 [Hanamia sp.]|nr:hypothetical protein [Hanamia sp.]